MIKIYPILAKIVVFNPFFTTFWTPKVTIGPPFSSIFSCVVGKMMGFDGKVVKKQVIFRRVPEIGFDPVFDEF